MTSHSCGRLAATSSSPTVARNWLLKSKSVERPLIQREGTSPIVLIVAVGRPGFVNHRLAEIIFQFAGEFGNGLAAGKIPGGLGLQQLRVFCAEHQHLGVPGFQMPRQSILLPEKLLWPPIAGLPWAGW